VETSIKQMIEIDKKAQEIISDAKATEETFKQKLNDAKKELSKRYWDEAQKVVENRKTELSNLIDGASQRNYEAHQVAITKIDKMFSENETKWKDELLSRCLGSKYE